jgi:hypothetical protein
MKRRMHNIATIVFPQESFSLAPEDDEEKMADSQTRSRMLPTFHLFHI